MDGGNTFRRARFLGTATLGNGSSPTVRVSDTIEAGERVEWYRFRIMGRPSSLKPILTFAGSEFVPQFQLFQAVNGKPKKSLARLDTINSQVQRSLPQGTFFIKITGTPVPAGSSGLSTFAASISLFG